MSGAPGWGSIPALGAFGYPLLLELRAKVFKTDDLAWYLTVKVLHQKDLAKTVNQIVKAPIYGRGLYYLIYYQYSISGGRSGQAYVVGVIWVRLVLGLTGIRLSQRKPTTKPVGGSELCCHDVPNV
jgi:hypothetical protein